MDGNLYTISTAWEVDNGLGQTETGLSTEFTFYASSSEDAHKLFEAFKRSKIIEHYNHLDDYDKGILEDSIKDASDYDEFMDILDNFTEEPLRYEDTDGFVSESYYLRQIEIDCHSFAELEDTINDYNLDAEKFAEQFDFSPYNDLGEDKE